MSRWTWQALTAGRRVLRPGAPSGRHIFTHATALGLATVLGFAACNEYPAEVADPEAGDAETTAPPVATRPRGYEGYMEGGPIRSGFILGRDGNPREIQYEIHNGRAILEGDIILGLVDQVPTTAAELMARVRPRGGVDGTHGVFVEDAFRWWPGGIVPYEIHDHLDDDARITSAIDVVERATAGVDLVPRSGQSEYIRFVAGTDTAACSSSIGMVAGGQDIFVVPNCGGWSSIAHEILHALGLRHEQSRCDRDTYVDIVWENIIPGRENNFVMHCDGHNTMFDYDESSIMHYSRFAFALIPDQPTIVSKRGRDEDMGSRSGLTRPDAETVNEMYGVFNDIPVAVVAPLDASYPEGTPVPFDASASHDADDERLWFDWNFKDGTCDVAGRPGYCETAVANHPYKDNGVYDVQLVVRDYPAEYTQIPGFKTDVLTVTVTIDNVPPTVDAGGPATVDEGANFFRISHFSDPGSDSPYTLTVDYGEGHGAQPLTVGTNKSFTLDHAYIDNKPSNAAFTVTVTATDKDGGTGEDDAPVTVLNLPPLVDAGASATVTSGETFNFSGTFTDAGVLDAPWSWQIDWGNGQTTTGNTNTQSSPITASLTVCKAGSYAVRFDVTDKDGGTNVDFLSLTVPPFTAGLLILPGGEPNPVNLRRGGLLPIAILSTQDFAATDVDPSTIMVGDGAGTETPVAQHNSGAYQFSIEDVNGDGLADLVPLFDVRTLVANGDLTNKSTMLMLTASLADACTEIQGEGAVVVR